MKLALLAPAVVTIAIAVSGSAVAGPAQSAGGLPCVPKVVKIQGKTAYEVCGPATASLSVSGKTYSFKPGLCESSGKGVLLLQLGTLVAGSTGNAGQAAFDITVNGTNAILTGYSKGKKLIPVADFLVTVKTTGKYTGTFAAGSGGSKLTGAWNCHGVVYTTPG
jgi:hypothetical protein